jgi:prevent-host-death family protein
MSETAAEMPISDAREQLAEVVGRARYNGEETILTHYGKPAAVVISFEQYQRLKGTEVLQLPPEIESIIEDGRRHPERRHPRPQRAARGGTPEWAASSSTTSRETYTRPWRRPGQSSCSTQIDDAVDLLESDPGSAAARHKSYTAGVWGIPVRTRTDDWLVIWEHDHDDPGIVVVRFIGQDPFA